jgi:hypothetical protein
VYGSGISDLLGRKDGIESTEGANVVEAHARAKVINEKLQDKGLWIASPGVSVTTQIVPKRRLTC